MTTKAPSDHIAPALEVIREFDVAEDTEDRIRRAVSILLNASVAMREGKRS